MRFGLQLGGYRPGPHGNHWDTLRAAVQTCEQTGFDSVWVADHFMFPDKNAPEREVPVSECFVTLSAIAAATSRIRLGELVVGVPYRNPALLAKMCAMLDVISHGRSIIGLGAAWHKPEFDAYGWDFPALRDRMRMLEEAVQVVDRMLTTRPASFHGQFYTVEDAYNDPMPVQQPRPPIMIGGDGERVTLRLVAQYAEFCNVFGSPETVAHKFGVLRQHCEQLGRDFEAITRSNHVSILIARDATELERKRERLAGRLPGFEGIIGTPDTVISRLREYAEIGSQYVTFSMPDAEEIEPVRLFGETIIPALADL
jgi:F420-dependent oxidoreductase-like protein